MGSVPEDQIAVLQTRVRERLAEVRPLRPATPEYADACDAVIAVAGELIDYEQRMPVLLDEGPQRVSLQVVRASGAEVTAIGLALAVAASTAAIPRWWLLLVALMIAVGVALLWMRVPGPCADHLALRPGAATAAAGALVIGVGTVGTALWLVGAGTVLLIGGFTHAERSGAHR